MPSARPAPTPRRAALRPSGAALLTGFLAAACGGGATDPDTGRGPVGRAGLTIEAGGGVTDTIDARLPQALRVAVRDGRGRAAAGVVVRFEALGVPYTLPDFPGQTFTVASASVGQLSAPTTGAFAAETTSSAGLASVLVRLGSVAGPAGVVVAVPDLGLVDTVRYTVRPGGPARLSLLPADTSFRAAGGSLALRTTVRDRSGNAVSGAVTYRAAAGAVAVSASGVVTATGVTRGTVVATVAGAAKPETAYVSAVPAGTLAVRRGGKLVVTDLDGGGWREVALPLTVNEPSPEWHPDGQSLLVAATEPGSGSALYAVTLQGAAERVFPPQASSGYFSVPGAVRSMAYDADGGWVYLTGNNCNSNGILYRGRTGGAGTLERLSPAPAGSSGFGADDCFDTVHLWPSPSPDGTRVVFEHDSTYYGGFTLRLLDPATRAVTPLGVAGQRPRWSPQGDLIAYVRGSQVRVVRPDGTGDRAVTAAGRFFVPGVTWSPDGRYLLARVQPAEYNLTTVLVLLDVQGGAEVPLPLFTGYDTFGLPAWRRAP